MSEEIENISLWKKYKDENDEAARKKLIMANLSIVKYQAGRIKMLVPDFIEKDDLESFGIMGLIDAVEKFNPELGFEFSTYASKRVRGEIIDHLRKLDWLPASLRREGKRIRKKARELSQKLGRNPSRREIAEEIDLPQDKIDKIYQKLNSSDWVSLYQERGDGEVIDLVQAGRKNRPQPEYNKKEALKILTEAIEKLPESEQLVISLYYYEELTQKEIAEVMELSSARISQLHKKAVQRLRGFLSRRKQDVLEV